ncbi:MAG TPA: hypothetical protein VNG71_18355 [Pyrinomonadaceae bacterium]|nr:hypothetical protein [Pyrinomonadaceae bacterium]
MELTLIILLSAAPIGAFDVIYYHLWKFRLFERPESFKEEITHILRGLLAPTLGGIVLIGRPAGLWFWVVVALFACDTINSLVDVMLEPASRLPRTVPPLELASHFIGTTSTGAAWAVFMLSGWGTRSLPNALMPYTHSFLPSWFFPLAFGTLFAAYSLLFFEAFLFTRAILRRRSGAGPLMNLPAKAPVS